MKAAASTSASVSAAFRSETAFGKYEWTQKLPENATVFDPLNVQIEIRKNVINNVQEFSMLMPNLKPVQLSGNVIALFKIKLLRLPGR